MKKLLPVILLSLLAYTTFAQRKVDVLHYKYLLEVNDANDTLRGTAIIKVEFLQNAGSFDLDIILDDGEHGMIIQHAAGKDLRGFFRVGDEKIRLMLIKPMKQGDTATYTINYKGVPGDGLIISKNKYGKRTFFSDNWPNRARYWIPCIDDPADKATVEFMVTAPSHYQVISNGTQLMVLNIDEKRKLSHWKEAQELPTKVMVIGIAEFAVEEAGMVDNIPVSSWVFPQNQRQGFHDYAQAVDILKFFIDYIGPYPYKKLANVQSKTIFGGMENASAIFYAENSVTGNRSGERTVAHEIAHQWFGNMVTEQHFSHLWLSEGFATYMSHIYLEKKYGIARLKEELRTDRKQVIEFAKEQQRPVVDSTTRLMDLLNANSYQKGGWILHMLRRETGDSLFQAIIRKFYSEFAGGNAISSDFKEIVEEVTGRDWNKFFHQWLHYTDIPTLEVSWISEAEDKNIMVNVVQQQENLFEFPLHITIKMQTGETLYHSLNVNEKNQSFLIETNGKVKGIEVDPAVDLLAEIVVVNQ